MKPSTGRSLAAVLAIGIAICGVYACAMRAPFIFDDEDAIVTNRSIERLWPLVGSDAERGPLNPRRDISTSGRPLVNLSLAVNYRLGGRDPLGYHLVNVLLHWLAALLLWAIVRRTLRLEYFQGRCVAAAEPVALLVALLWALHPLATETVAYITQRTELLMACAYLATLYASLRYWASDSRSARNAWLLLAASACLAGMASKEVMVTAPLVVLLLERTFLAGSFRRALVQSWPLYAALALGWLLLFALNIGAPRSASAGLGRGVPVYVWWFTQAKVLMTYLRLAVWPWPLSIHHHVPYVDSLPAAWPWLVCVALLGMATVALVVRGRAAGFLAATVFLVLAPTSLVPIITEVAAERRMYLPLAALVCLAVCGGYLLVARFFDGRGTVGTEDQRPILAAPLVAVITVGVLIALACGAASVQRLLVYNDPVALWTDALAHQPDNAVARTNLGVALSSAGRGDEAIAQYEAALRLDPDERGARINMAKVYYNQALPLIDQGRSDTARPLIEKALVIDPASADAHYALGRMLLDEGNLAAAAQQFAAATQGRPDFIAAQIHLGIALVNLGQLAPAASAATEALRLDPNNADAHFILGIALARQNQAAEASRHFAEVVRLDRRRADAHFELANTLVAQRDFSTAATHYREAVHLQPDNVAALQNLGAVLLELRQPDEAIKYLEETLLVAPDSEPARANLERAREMGQSAGARP